MQGPKQQKNQERGSFPLQFLLHLRVANFSRNMSWTVLSDEVLWSFRHYKLQLWQHVARETENLHTEWDLSLSLLSHAKKPKTISCFEYNWQGVAELCFWNINNYLKYASWYLLITVRSSSGLLLEYDVARSWYGWLNGLINLPTTCDVYFGMFWICNEHNYYRDL
jgi:hypothetical protein